MRAEFLPFALPDTDDSELEEIKEVLDSGWLTSGPKTRQLEEAFGKYVGATHSVAVNSATAAMHLSLEAIGLQRDDEVITTPYTFAASAEVIRHFDARPVLVDVNADDFNINASLIEAAITERTRALLPIHIAGAPADLDAIYAIAKRHGLAVVEDAAHALPTRYQGRVIGSPHQFAGKNGSLTATVCFSFYATKSITTGEGGMLCTEDEELAERCRSMSLHGISKDAWKRSTSESFWHYDIVEPGYKYNMTDVAAAMGLAQLRKADRMWKRRSEIAQRYNEAFNALSQLQIPNCRDDFQHGWYLYMLRLVLGKLKIDRAQFAEELRRANIGVSVHFIPLHIHPYYRQMYGYQPDDYPVAYQEYLREVSLPNL